MHFIILVNTAIYITQVMCSEQFQSPTLPTTDHTPFIGKDNEAPQPPGQHGVAFHILQHQILPEQQSKCVWSANRTKQYCVFADTLFDHGKGITIMTTPDRAHHLFESHALASDHPNSAQKPLFKTQASGSKGRGIFAQSHIAAGSLITEESPIMFIDQNMAVDIESEESRVALQAVAVEELPHSTRHVFQELYAGPDTDNRGHKILTNSYGVYGGPLGGWPGLQIESDAGMMAVHANISLTAKQKINHDCRANAAAQWDWETFAHKLYAVRDIAANEEITISYFHAVQTLQARQQYTKHTLGFQCACRQCKATGEFAKLSDDRISEIQLLEEYLENRQIAPAEPTAMAELLVDLYEQEGLHVYISKAYAIAALEWNGAGYEFQARSRAYQSVKAGLLVGANVGLDEYLDDMQVLLDGARKHWSWKYRSH